MAHHGILSEVTVRTPTLSYRAMLTAGEIFKMKLLISEEVVGSIVPEALHTL